MQDNQTTLQLEIHHITTQASFEQAVLQLKHSPEIALDLEFDNNRYSYGLNLCLIQVANRQHCYIIDPFAIKNLRLLWNLIEDPSIAKILHCANADIMLLKTLGCYPKHIIDTEVAAKILNYTKTSLAHVLQVNLGIEMDKTLQISNWNTRPLTKEQLQYAALDVTYLHELKDKVVEDVKKINCFHWLEEEGKYLELLEQRENADAHLKLKEANRLTYFQQFVLKSIFEYRNGLASDFNKPPAFIIPNEVLINLAARRVTKFQDWQNTKGLFWQIKGNDHFRHFQQVVNEAEAEATAQKISHQHLPPYRKPSITISSEEVDRRKKIMQAIQQVLFAQYGQNAATLVLSQGIVNDFYFGKKLAIRRKYAMDIILEIAQGMAIQPEQLPIEDVSAIRQKEVE